MRCDCAPPRIRRTCWLMKIAKFLTRHCPTERAGQFINNGGFPEWNGRPLFYFRENTLKRHGSFDVLGVLRLGHSPSLRMTVLFFKRKLAHCFPPEPAAQLP